MIWEGLLNRSIYRKEPQTFLMPEHLIAVSGEVPNLQLFTVTYPKIG